MKRYVLYIHYGIWYLVLATGVFLSLSPIFFGYDGECGTRPDLVEGNSNCYVGSDMSGIAVFIGVPIIAVAGLVLLITYFVSKRRGLLKK
jgi:hypothetical protein